MEKNFQSKAIKWLKEQGAYVIKTSPGMGTPVGCPDLIVLFRERHAEIECKASATAPYGVGQKATLQHLGRGNDFVYTAYPENWEEIKSEMLTHFF